MSKPGSWAGTGSRRIAAVLRWIGALTAVLPISPIAPTAAIAPVLAALAMASIACPCASAGTVVASARFEEARPRVVAWLSRGDAAVGEEVILTIEVIGPISVDVSLGDPEPVAGLLFLAAAGPIPAIRTDTTASGVVTRNYVATFTVPIRVLSGGRHEITPPAVIGPDESAWTPPPLILDARGPSADTSRKEPRLEVVGPSEPVFAGERVPVRVRVEVDDAVCPMEARTFTFPWWDQVVALDPSVQASSGAKWAIVQGADYRVQLSAGSSDSGGMRAFSGVVDVVPVRAGTMSLEGSRFSAVAAGTGSSSTLGAATVTALSSEASIVVVPLPSLGQPPGFVDLVGDFDVHAAIDRDVLLVGEAFTLTLDVRERSGATNLAFARIIDPPQWPGFRPLDEPRYETAAGRCQVRFVFAPEEVVTEAPALGVSWFQPAARAYETTALGPFPLTVTARPMPGRDRDEAGAGLFAGALLMALRYGWVFALLIALGFAWRRLRRPRPSKARAPAPDDASTTDASELASASANTSAKVSDRQEARARFDEARRAAKMAGTDALAASQALARYIADRRGVSPAACFGGEAFAHLSDLGVPADLADRAVRHFLAAERRAFGDDPPNAGCAEEEAAKGGWDDACSIVASIDAAIG